MSADGNEHDPVAPVITLAVVDPLDQYMTYKLIWNDDLEDALVCDYPDVNNKAVASCPIAGRRFNHKDGGSYTPIVEITSTDGDTMRGECGTLTVCEPPFSS